HNDFDFTIFGNEAPQLVAKFIPPEEEENRANEEVVVDQSGDDAVVNLLTYSHFT
ncbi:hypothetical protein TorRG33x02_182460, partial [Trema orientale]